MSVRWVPNEDGARSSYLLASVCPAGKMMLWDLDMFKSRAAFAGRPSVELPHPRRALSVIGPKLPLKP